MGRTPKSAPAEVDEPHGVSVHSTRFSTLTQICRVLDDQPGDLLRVV